jgi:metal-responsive CopG/Arc/MetJ family transcriptional regulator
VSVNVKISDDLAAQIDRVARDRAEFIERAVRKLLGETSVRSRDELARINQVADQLNEEAAEVLEFQVLS